MNVQKECEGFGSHGGDRNVRAHYVIHIYQCCTEICDLKGTRVYHFSIYLTLKMEAACFFQTENFYQAVQSHNPTDSILQVPATSSVNNNSQLICI